MIPSFANGLGCYYHERRRGLIFPKGLKKLCQRLGSGSLGRRNLAKTQDLHVDPIEVPLVDGLDEDLLLLWSGGRNGRMNKVTSHGPKCHKFGHPWVFLLLTELDPEGVFIGVNISQHDIREATPNGRVIDGINVDGILPLLILEAEVLKLA